MNIYVGVTNTLLPNLVIETIIYVNHKSKAKLFIKIKVLMLVRIPRSALQYVVLK